MSMKDKLDEDWPTSLGFLGLDIYQYWTWTTSKPDVFAPQSNNTGQ